MFIHNFKLNGNKILKTTLIISVIVIIILIIYTVYSVINKAKIEGEKYENNEITENLVTEIKSYEYTNFLKSCHENIDDYIDKQVKITGYIYRLPTFENNQFVLARTMILDSNNTAVVVRHFITV